MMLRCPKCEEQDLVDAMHGSSRCPACRGMFVPSSRVGELLASGHDAGPASNIGTGRDAVGGQCPQDHTIMSRTVVDVGGDAETIHLERCGSCHGVWFDAGEWSLLAEKQLLDHLDEFWSVEWRNRQRRNSEREEYEGRLREMFGEELYSEIRTFAAKLRNHPRRSQVLAVLREELGGR